MAAALTAITDRVHMAKTQLVNWTLVTDDSGVMLIDAGFPGSRDDVVASLHELGVGPEDLRAILLTHAHIDHLGSAIWFAKTHGTPVYCHTNEVGHAKRDYLQQASPLDLMKHMWQPRWLRWSLEIASKGALVGEGIPTTQALTDELAEQLPGRPIAIPTPGHTSGHCSYLVDGVLITGDALITGHPLAPHSGPQLLPAPFNHNEDDCRRNLAALVSAESDVLVPGHGDFWIGPISKAVDRASSGKSVNNP